MGTNNTALDAGTIMIGDFHLNRLGFGAMRITGEGIWGEPHDREEAKKVLQRAIELDINFIDTADAYGPEVSERLIKEALAPYEGIIIATKGGLTRGGPGQWTPDCSSQHLREACDASLARLGVERIDVYQLHTVDPNVAFEESFQTLLDLQKEGKIRHIGLSNIEPEHFEIAQKMGQFVSVQNNYNVLNREHEDVLQLCEQNNIAFIPYFPIGGNQENGVAGAVLSELADKYDVSARQIALAWILLHSTATLPIPGTSSVEHLEKNVAAATIKLDDQDMEKLNHLTQ
jgi:pyridoxine 4-dehydrogenase